MTSIQPPSDQEAPGVTRRQGAGRNPLTLPLAILTTAVLVMAGLQSWALWNERARLDHALATQQPTIDQAKKMRAQLDSLSRETARLAEAGNPNAQALLQELARKGVRFDFEKGAAESGSGE